MNGLKEILASITDWMKGIVSLGLVLALVFLIVDLLFGPTTGIVANITLLVKSFTDQGIVGLIALIIFVSIYSK